MSYNKLQYEKVPFHTPSLEEVANVLQSGLAKNFADVEVSVVECPDLTQKPFMLAASGLCGKPVISDIGGVPYLIPSPQLDKTYDLKDIAANIAGVPDALVLGAGAGPRDVVGVNSEMMANFKLGGEKGKDFINTHICKISPETNSWQVEKLPADCTGCALLVNLYISEGKPGKVIQVKASKRTGPENFMKCLRLTLAKQYGTKPVGLGGTFVVEKGKCRLHVMPDFSKTPLTTDEDMGKWLRFFEMEGPLTALGYLVSHDPDLDLRVEHFHCFSDHGNGGHYHNDTTPNDVSYLAYFNVPEYMIRVDRPLETHTVGRD